MAEAYELRKKGVAMYDYTKLTAVNTCPTWGVLRYGLHKTEIPLDQGGRNTAIECGAACHDYFAALRLWALREQTYTSNISMDLVGKHALKLFGQERWHSMLAIPQDSDRINNAQLFALDALHTSGYVDTPEDRKRTMANMEAACLAYTDRYFKSELPVYVEDALVGIEIPFVVQVTNTFDDMSTYYCGRIDGVHTWEDKIIVAENKTTSRLSDVWRMQFALSHQVTGYLIAASCLFERELADAIVMGVQIPPPKDIFNGCSFELVTRTTSDSIRWCEWLFHSVAAYEAYMDNPTLAPRYSHSCNRFFSACQFIPYCSLPREEQEQVLEDMRTDEWSPLDHIIEETTDA